MKLHAADVSFAYGRREVLRELEAGAILLDGSDMTSLPTREVVIAMLNRACRYAHHLAAMRDGRVRAAGEPRTVVDAELVHAVLNLRAEILDDPVTGALLCVPLGRAARALRPPAVEAARS